MKVLSLLKSYAICFGPLYAGTYICTNQNLHIIMMFRGKCCNIRRFTKYVLNIPPNNPLTDTINFICTPLNLFFTCNFFAKSDPFWPSGFRGGYLSLCSTDGWYTTTNAMPHVFTIKSSSESEYVESFLIIICLYIYCCLRSYYQKGYVMIPLSGLTPSQVCVCPKPEHAFPTSWSLSCLISWDER